MHNKTTKQKTKTTYLGGFSLVLNMYMYAVGYNMIEIRDGTSSLLYWD